MLIVMLKSFYRWAKVEKVSHQQLIKAIDEIHYGLVDANLGSGLVKKRISRDGKGKRRGFRTLLAFQENDRAIFLIGFAKNEYDNITVDQLVMMKNLSKEYLNLDDKQFNRLIQKEHFIEVK